MKNKDTNYSVLGLGFGVAFGTIFNNIGIGIFIGVIIGLIIDVVKKSRLSTFFLFVPFKI